MSPAGPGVVIQLDGHGAKRLAMTLSGFIAANTQASLGLCSRSDTEVRSHDALVEHRVRDFDEAGDVGAEDVIAG